MTRPPLSLRKWNLRRWLYLQYILFVSSFVWTACKNTDDLHLQPRQRLSSLVQNITAPYYINLYQHLFIAPPHPHRHHRHSTITIIITTITKCVPVRLVSYYLVRTDSDGDAHTCSENKWPGSQKHCGHDQDHQQGLKDQEWQYLFVCSDGGGWLNVD